MRLKSFRVFKALLLTLPTTTLVKKVSVDTGKTKLNTTESSSFNYLIGKPKLLICMGHAN